MVTPSRRKGHRTKPIGLGTLARNGPPSSRSGFRPVQLKDSARRLRDDIWAIFESLLPARVVVGNGPRGHPGMPSRPPLRPGVRGRMGDAPVVLPVLPDRPTAVHNLAPPRRVPGRVEATGRAIPAVARISGDQILLDGSKKPAKTGAPRRAVSGRTRQVGHGIHTDPRRPGAAGGPDRRGEGMARAPAARRNQSLDLLWSFSAFDCTMMF